MVLIKMAYKSLYLFQCYYIELFSFMYVWDYFYILCMKWPNI